MPEGKPFTGRLSAVFAVLLDEAFQGLHGYLDGVAGVLAHVLVKTGLLPLLIPHRVETTAAAHAEGGGRPTANVVGGRAAKAEDDMLRGIIVD